MTSKVSVLSLAFHWSSRKLQVFPIPVTHNYCTADQNNPWLTMGTRQPPYLQWSHLSVRHFWCNKVKSEFSPFIFKFYIWQNVIRAQWLMENWDRLSASDKRQSLCHWRILLHWGRKGEIIFNNVFSGVLSTICKKFSLTI